MEAWAIDADAGQEAGRPATVARIAVVVVTFAVVGALLLAVGGWAVLWLWDWIAELFSATDD